MSRSRARTTYTLSDDQEHWRALPNYEPTGKAAHYFISPLGHVFRDDGFLVRPTPVLRDLGSPLPNKDRPALVIKIAGGKRTYSLPALVYYAFGFDEHGIALDHSHRAWVWPTSPHDRKTGHYRCSVEDVCVVSHSDVLRYYHSGALPTNPLRLV